MNRPRRALALTLCLALLCACLPLFAHAEEARPVLQHYLVLGQDYYSASGVGSARTDTIMVVSLDSTNNRIIFTSVLRDSKVTTPGGGENKLNTVYRYHGFEGVRSTIEKHLGIALEGTIVFDFDSIKALIDALGGVDIEITAAEYGNIYSILLGQDPNMPKGPGMAHMTGRIALAYMRDRSSGAGDFTRTEHQRKVLGQLLAKCSALSISDLLNVYNALRSGVQTDLSEVQVLQAMQIAYKLLRADAQEVEYHIPAKRTYSYGELRGSSVLSVNWKRNRILLDALLYPAQPASE